MLHQIVGFCAQNWMQIVQTACELISTTVTVAKILRTSRNTPQIQAPRHPKKKRMISSHVKLSITLLHFDIDINR